MGIDLSGLVYFFFVSIFLVFMLVAAIFVIVMQLTSLWTGWFFLAFPVMAALYTVSMLYMTRHNRR